MNNDLYSKKGAKNQVLLTISVFALSVVGYAQEVVNTVTHRLEQVSDGVYFATGTGDIYTMSNALIIERDDDIVIVDSHITPAAGRALLDSIRVVSDKPVTTMINSHFHYDHSNGTPAFGEKLEIIGHEVTYEKLTGDPENEHTFQSSLRRFDSTVARLEDELAGTTNSDERRQIQNKLEYWRRHVEAQSEIVFTPLNSNIERQDDLHVEAGKFSYITFLVARIYRWRFSNLSSRENCFYGRHDV